MISKPFILVKCDWCGEGGLVELEKLLNGDFSIPDINVINETLQQVIEGQWIYSYSKHTTICPNCDEDSDEPIFENLSNIEDYLGPIDYDYLDSIIDELDDEYF